MDIQSIQPFVQKKWDESIVSELVEYIKIPNKSPLYDRDWEANGYMEAAVAQLAGWAEKQGVAGMQLEIVRLPGRTPLIFMEVPGAGEHTLIMYGHLDKQPEMAGWEPDLGPWKPVLRGDKLYGRGGADDGYALFASLTALAALQRAGIAHGRCVILIEACEESGSADLPYYVTHLAERIGTPDLVICLDSGCGNYDQMWLTTSLRGNIGGTLHVDVVSEGIHSGDASGIVPSSYRILRQLLDRLEDAKSGQILPRQFHCQIPEQRVEQARLCAQTLGGDVAGKFPFLDGVRPVSDDTLEQVLNRTWRPTLCYTGSEGLPGLDNAGNVLRPGSALRLSLRLPPLVDGEQATRELQQILEADPPYGAHVRFEPEAGASGWNAPLLSPWLEASADAASQMFFGRKAVYMGEGGSIPFMAMLGEKFPQSEFLITGVLGPKSNAHGPNEFLHIPTGKRLTCCVAKVIADHHRNKGNLDG